MHDRVHDSHSRSFAKAVSWRILGTIDTFVITLLVTGSIKWAGSIASVESVSKILLFYLHERAWGKLRPQNPAAIWTRPLASVFGKFAPENSLTLAPVSPSSHLPEEASK
jgi:uncharacterized membrane protein